MSVFQYVVTVGCSKAQLASQSLLALWCRVVWIARMPAVRSNTLETAPDRKESTLGKAVSKHCTISVCMI